MTTLSKTLTQLEKNDWGSPPKEAPPSVQEVFRLRNKPLRELSVEDLRLLIGQDVGLEYLMPLAVGYLSENPLAKGEHYHGDLLSNVLRANPQYFADQPKVRRSVKSILSRAYQALSGLDEIDAMYAREGLDEARAGWGDQ